MSVRSVEGAGAGASGPDRFRRVGVAPNVEPGMEAPEILPLTSDITLANRWDHLLARCGVGRTRHLVQPGLYALGTPTADSPVLVTANYTLTVDALRSALRGTDCFLMILDTVGTNVWCAAARGSFGTDELVDRIEDTRLAEVVRHRTLIVPQLAAVGVAAHQVKKRSKFRVEYGPIRSADLARYLKTGAATAEMRRVRFTLADRLVLIPVEIGHVLLPTLVTAAVLFFLGGFLAVGASVAAAFVGVVAFPILLPWVPTRDFSSKGFILGVVAALPFVLVTALDRPGAAWWLKMAWSADYLLAMPPITAYLALNFTGSTPFASPSSVRREVQTYMPLMVRMVAASVALLVASGVARTHWGA